MARLITLLMALLCVAPAGCVRRRLTVRSNPPGALVFVDDQEIGVTPVSTEFTYYGTRKLQLFKDGFETVTVKQKFPVPWYEVPPLDFVVENFWPWEVRDERVVDFQLIPQQLVPAEKLHQRAEALRRSARQDLVTPLWTAPANPGGVPPPPHSPTLSPGLRPAEE